MKHLIQAFLVLLALSFAATPAIAKDDSKSSKAKSSETKKAKKKKEKKEKKEKSSKSKSSKKDKPSKSSKTEKSSKSSSKDKKKDKASDSKTSKSSKSSSSSKSSDSSSSSSKSSKKSTAKKTVKSGLTGTDKAKQFKNVTVNINKADAGALAYYLVGIGETRAKDIVKYRSKNGKFKSVEGLMEVPGIGEAIYAGLKKNTSTSRGESSVPKKTSSKKK